MNVYWFQIRSWHILRPDTRVENMAGRGYCGKVVRGAIFDERGEGKTCERCYQIGGPR